MTTSSGVSKKAVVAATDARVAEAAAALLPRASAVDAVVAGVFVAAALSPSVLFGPVQILVGGPGMGLRAIDGRTRQPGRGAPRPRGFVAGDAVPDAARVGVPASVAALAAALAMTASELPLARALAPAVAAAKAEGAKARAEVLARIGRRGATALAEADVAEAVVAAAGRLAGGVVTAEDLAAVSAVEEPCRVEEGGERAAKRRVARAPWSEEGSALADTRVVAAADGRGRVAIACYEVTETGVDLPAIECLAPLTAEPVRRGETRVRPGTPLPARAPMALLEVQGALEAALGFGGARGEASLTAALAAFFTGQPIDLAARAAVGARAVGVVRTRDGARVVGADAQADGAA